MSFAALIAGAEPVESGFRAHIPDEWLQGRTCYGGLSTALALEAARRAAPDLPPLRSAQVAFVGPLAGDVEVLATVLREGRNATWIAAQIQGEKGVGLRTTFVFMRPLDSALDLTERGPPDGLVPLADARTIEGGMRPAFITNNFEMRFAVPKPDAPQAEICWWARLLDREGLSPAQELLLVGDALPPAVLPMMQGWAPVSSLTWQVNVLGEPEPDADGWWLLRSTADHAGAGNSSQFMDGWTPGGTRVIAATQSIAVFG